jgi:predicted nucleic acid-binding protein
MEARCMFATLNFKIDRPPQIADFPRLHSLATAHQLTAYDAAYLDLAKRPSLPLATRDVDLRRAALAEGRRRRSRNCGGHT